MTERLPGHTKTLSENATDSEALRIFYTSLYEQRPDSEMAQRFLVQHGLLPRHKAQEICERLKIGVQKEERQQPCKGKQSSTERKQPSSKSNTPQQRQKKKKTRKVHDSSDEDSDSEGEYIVQEDEVCDCGTSRHLPDIGIGFSGEWISCDKCEKWFHADCYNLTSADISTLAEWYCNACISSA